ASRPPMGASSSVRSQSSSAGGRRAVPSECASSPGRSSAGSSSCRLSTEGLPSILAAWLSVMPVTENSSMPTRQAAELIQCHWCRVRSQKPRRWRAAAEMLLEGCDVTPASEADVEAQPQVPRLVLVVVVVHVLGGIGAGRVLDPVGLERSEVAVEQVVDACVHAHVLVEAVLRGEVEHGVVLVVEI